MRRLIPSFILDTDPQQEAHGRLQGSSLFIDLSGFTRLTSALMEHGDAGAETLSGIINTLFDPLIAEIESAGGFISTFAGDALTAVFLDQSPLRAAGVAGELLRVIDRNHLQYTPAGEFPVEAKVGIGSGDIEWGTIHGRERSTYYVRGQAIDEAAAAEHHGTRGEIILGPRAREAVAESVPAHPRSDDFAVLDRSRLSELAAEEGSEEVVSASASISVEGQERFIPLEALPGESAGEFRSVAPVFVSFHAPSRHEPLADLVRPLLDLAHEYGGYFNLLDFGDKGGLILVLFGAPRAHGDDTERAADFALAANATLGNRGRQGLAAGTVFAGYVGNDSRSTYTALGSVVNLAARLAMDAEAGSTNTAGEAAERLESRHSLTELDKRSFKGFSREMPVYSLAGMREVTQTELAFTGRAAQLAELQGAIDEMLSSPVCTHYVVGEAGIGKSRLVRHMADRQAEDAVTVFLEAETILRKSMNPLPRLVRGIFEITQIDIAQLDGATAMERLVAWLREREVEEELLEELSRTGSGLMSLLGQVGRDSLYARLDPQARFELIVAGFRTLVGAISEVYPLLVILDNAHALDADSRSILARLVASSAGDHFGVIFAGRGEEGENPFGIEEQVESERMTALHGMSAEETREIVESVIQAPVEQSLVDFVIHRVGTNPLYVTEITRYLLHHRLLVRGNQGYHVSTANVSLPTEINSLLVARIDALPARLKQAAQAAAVLGAEFDPVVLERLMNAGPDFQEILAEGVDAGLWARSDEGSYRFQQDLLRHALEEMQLSARLQELHSRASSLLQQLHPNDPSLQADLAYHYIRAGMPTEAGQALRNAADYALENFKNEKALEFLESYQSYAESLDDRIRAYRDMASVYELTGKWAGAIDTLTYAVGLSVITNNLAARGRLLTNLGEVYRKQSEIKTAVAILEQARQLAKREQDWSTYAEALINLGRSHWARGEFSDALAHFDQALKTSTDHDDLKLEGQALYYQGVVYREQNRYDDADRNFRNSYEIFEQIGDDRLSTYPLYDLGVLRLYQGSIDEAKDYFQRALDVYERIGYESGASAAILNLGVLRDRRGDFSAAIALYQQAREIAERINEHMAIGYTLFSIGATYYKMGDNRKALAYLRDALKILKRLSARGYYAYVLSYLVSLFARTGNGDRAIHTALQHTQVVAQVGTDPENGRAVLGLATLLERGTSLSQDAGHMLRRIARHYGLSEVNPRSLYEKAIEISDPPKYVDTLIPAHFRYAEYLQRRGDTERFRAHLKTAFELAAEAHWDRFIRKTRENYGEKLAEMGVDTDIETEDFDIQEEPA